MQPLALPIRPLALSYPIGYFYPIVTATELREVLASLNLSQRQLAKRMRVNERTARYWVSKARQQSGRPIPLRVAVAVDRWLQRLVATP